jgi:phosphatidylserine/phosphatidylglycerophosphate/cardiolipin synthase-like enzyme
MQPVADDLLAHGVHVDFTNQTYFGWTHNKGVIADGQRVLISSINWSNESVSENREAGVIIHHSGVANYFAQVFQWDWVVGEYLGDPTTPPGVPLEWIIISGIATVIVIIGIFIYNWLKKRK